MKDILKSNINNVYNKTVDLYSRHNTRINFSTLEYEVLPNLKQEVSKKISSNVLLTLTSVYNKLLQLSKSDFDLKNKEEIKNNINSFLHLKDQLAITFNTLNINTSNLSFDEEFNNALRQIFKSDYAYNESLRSDLKYEFNDRKNQLSNEIKNELKRVINSVNNECNLIIEEQIRKFNIELNKNDKISNEKKEEKELEQKEIFIKAREDQRKQDKIDRARQIETRNMMYGNEENQLEQSGRSL